MDGFVINAAQTTGTDGHFVMWQYDETDLPFYYWLANKFAIADRHFAPMASGTFGNRNFMLFGTNAGVVDTGISFPPPNTPSIMQLLMNGGFTWGAYSDGDPASGALDWGPSDPGVHSLQEFLRRARRRHAAQPVARRRARLHRRRPSRSPTSRPARPGPRRSTTTRSPARSGRSWRSIWTYDEAGGFADHVPPPLGCQASPTNAPFTPRWDRAFRWWRSRRGPSAASRRTSPRDHTAIIRFIETVFDLPALTARDANSDALFDLFDFSCGRDLSVPAAPAAGTNGCPDPPPLGAH